VRGIQSGKHRDRERVEKNGKGRYFGSCEKKIYILKNRIVK
jgi:hypothetical protein